MNEGPDWDLLTKYELVFQGVGNGDWIYIDYESKCTQSDLVVISKAIIQAEKNGYCKDRERVLNLLMKFRNGRYCMNDDARIVIDELCDELWK